MADYHFRKWKWLGSVLITFLVIVSYGYALVHAQELQPTDDLSTIIGRCGTPPPPPADVGIMGARAVSDCTSAQSANLGEYTPSTLYTIPVWVHIIMDDTCTNGAISDQMVVSQIEVLNEDYRALMGTLGGNGNDVMVQFCLAGIDRTCNSTDFADNPGFKEALNVSPGNTLNMYTNNTGWLGYSTWPWTDGGQPHDGVVVRWSAFGRNSPLPPYDLGRSATHEIGHYLGLFHTFSGGCASAKTPACYSDGDVICDTNPEAVDHYGCTQTYSCDAALPDPIHNYMNYTDDACMEEFTPEQAQRIVCILQNYRTAFLQTGCTQAPVAQCTDVTVATEPGVCTAQASVDNSSNHPNGVPITLSQSPPGPYSPGPTTVTLTVTDSNGLSSSCSATVTVSDTEAPVIICPSSVTVECDQPTDPTNTGTPSVTDNCGALTTSHSDSEVAGSCAGQKTITRTWTTTDGSGNTSSCVQTISIVHTKPPEIFCPSDITIECDESTIPDHTGYATATDSCDSNPTVSALPDVVTARSCPQEKTITRTWTAADACNNVSTCTQIITIEDTKAPVIDCNAPPIITPKDAPISFTATATDNCSPTVSTEVTGFNCVATKSKLESCIVSYDGGTITILDSGGVRDKISWTVSTTDDCGNISEQTCEVRVVNPGKKK